MGNIKQNKNNPHKMNSVFAAVALATVSQAVRLTSEPVVGDTMMAAPTAAPETALKNTESETAAPVVEASDSETAPVVDNGSGMDFEASLESRATHEVFKHHQSNHMTENEHLQSVREQKTEEYFAAKDAAKHANDAAAAATAAEGKAHAELTDANAASAKATGEWEHAHAVMGAATEAHSAAVKAQADSAAHHATEVASAEAAGQAA